MPNSPNEEVQAMEDVFNEIHDKTDEEINKEEDDQAKKSAETGESIEEQTLKADTIPADQDPEPKEADPVIPDTSTTEVSVLQAKVDELESELKKEHQRTASWDGRIKAANQRVKELEAENLSLREAKPTVKSDEDASDQEVMDQFLTTFPEFTDVLGIFQKKIDAKSAANTPAKATVTYDPDAPLDDVEPEVKPVKVVAQEEHMSQIRKAHPAIDEMVSTGVMKTWINKQPDFISSHLMNIYKTGNADDIIKMTTEFLNKTKWKSSLSDPGEKAKQDKLESMIESEGQSPGPKTGGPDKNDFDQGAKDAGL